MEDRDLIAEVRGRAGRITLNRPKALNALTREMTLDMTRALLAWRDDPAVQCVVVDGAGDRAFCAGGDLRALYAQGRGGEPEEAEQFFRDEYRLNHLIRTYPKPYIALIGGVVMGGGVGISVHGSHRIAAEDTLLAMPECAIGLFPDVGATWLLPRLPHRAGYWLGLAGARIHAGTACALGIATHYAPNGFSDLIAALEHGASGVSEVVEALTGPPPADPTASRYGLTETAFAADSVEGVLAALDSEGSDWAQDQAKAIRQGSPTSLKMTFAALRRGADMPFANAMRKEMRMAAHCLEGHDFYEGVRAQIIDKDRQPKWSPATLDAVSEEAVAAHFEPLPEGRELDFIANTR